MSRKDSKHSNLYVRLSPEKALTTASINRDRILGDGTLPYGVPLSIVHAIDNAVASREKHMCAVYPTDRVEVDGLVRAAMGDFSHIRDTTVAGIGYVVGLVQLEPSAREQLFMNVGTK